MTTHRVLVLWANKPTSFSFKNYFLCIYMYILLCIYMYIVLNIYMYIVLCIYMYIVLCIYMYIVGDVNGFLCWVTCGTSWSCRMAGDVKRKYHAWRLAADRDTSCSCRGRLGAGSAPLPLLPHPLRMWQEVINQGEGGKDRGVIEGLGKGGYVSNLVSFNWRNRGKVGWGYVVRQSCHW